MLIGYYSKKKISTHFFCHTCVCIPGVLSVDIDLAFLFRRSPHTESRSWSSAPQIFFRDASIVKFWVDTDTMFKITIWPIADADTDVFLLFIPPFVPGKQTLTPHARTQTRTSYTRTHDDTGRGFYDLYEINLFISTTAPSTFNIKMISTWV